MVRIETRPSRTLRHLGVAAALATLHGLGGAQVGPATAPSPGAIAPIGVGSGTPDARRYTIEPGIRTRVDVSDNIDLTPNGPSGALLEVTPYVNATLNSPRGVGTLFFGLRGLFRDGGNGSSTEVRQDLRAWADIKLAEDNVRLLARANVFDVTASPFGSASFDPATQTSNRSQYRDFELSPYAFGRFDGDGQWSARYSLRFVDSGSTSSSSTINQLSAFARSDLVRRRFALSADLVAYDVGYQGGFDYRGETFDLLGWVRIDPTLRVGAGLGYSHNTILFNQDRENSGWGPTLAAEWTPDARTFVFGRVSDRYFGTAADLRASHRAARWTFGLQASKGISDGNRSSLYGMNTVSLFNAGAPMGMPAGTATNPVSQSLTDQNLLSPVGGAYGSGNVDSPLVYYGSLLASAGWTDARDSLIGALFVNNRRTAVAFSALTSQDIDQWGAWLQWTHRLNTRNALSASVRLTRSDDNLTGSQANLAGLWASWDYKLTARSYTSLGLRTQRQRGDGATVRFDEAAVFAMIDYRF